MAISQTCLTSYLLYIIRESVDFMSVGYLSNGNLLALLVKNMYDPSPQKTIFKTLK